jgi:large subunit ribosomal protein L4
MPKIQVKNTLGKDVREETLSEVVFGQVSNDTLLHQVYVAIISNLRQVLAHTKDRSERAGTGKKPWKQKGTGRARAGSVRSPLWRKGGVTFGPNKNRNFSKATTAKMRQKATMIALSEKVRSGKLVVLENFDMKEVKTKLAAEALEALGVAGRSAVIAFTTEEKKVERAFRNITRKTLTTTETLNVKDLLDHEYAVLSVDSLPLLEKRFAAWEKKN